MALVCPSTEAQAEQSHHFNTKHMNSQLLQIKSEGLWLLTATSRNNLFSIKHQGNKQSKLAPKP